MSNHSLESVRCMWMRGGTSKGGYFLGTDMPTNTNDRDALLLNLMGSPDPRQIDGMGGADTLTSKVAIISPSKREGVDVDYLFLQVFVDKPIVTDAQNCGNILAGVGPFAIERGLVLAKENETRVTIYMENTGQIAIARVQTPNKFVRYSGDTKIDGVPNSASPISIEFSNSAGSSCGALLPTGNASDHIDGVEVTLIDNGMPCVIIKASDFGLSGEETPNELDLNNELKKRLEAIRLQAGPLMNLGNVSQKSIPKMTLVSRTINSNAISTRTFIPHKCHKAIGVLGAVSVATACLTKGAVGSKLTNIMPGVVKSFSVEHPTGEMSVVPHQDANGMVERAEVVRTARKLMDGYAFTIPKLSKTKKLL